MSDYIDRNAAIEALRKLADDCPGSTEAATAAAMAISVISRLPGPWVSVKNEKPPLWVPVIVAYRDFYSSNVIHTDDVATRVDDNKWLWWDGEPRSCDDVVKVEIDYWMPLPDAPAMRKAEKDIREAAK